MYRDVVTKIQERVLQVIWIKKFHIKSDAFRRRSRIDALVKQLALPPLNSVLLSRLTMAVAVVVCLRSVTPRWDGQNGGRPDVVEYRQRYPHLRTYASVHTYL
jgi:hypothetical protein